MSSAATLIKELKRRNVLKLVAAYAVGSFVVLQLCDILFPALGIEDESIRYVLVALGFGLPFLALFAWMFEVTPEGLRRTREVDAESSITHFTGQRINHIIIGLLSLAVLFFAYEYFSRPDVTEPDATAAEKLTDVTPPATPSDLPMNTDTRPSIAVLPFVNMSSDAENEYFSDGLSEEVLNLLAQTQGLRVAGRTSSFYYKGKNENLTLIGESLNVDHLLEGSVRKSGNKVRITAQLISANDGFHLWSKTFDREISDIFAVQDEIAGEVTRAMQVTLLTDGVVVSDRSTTNSETYDLYLRAKNALYSRQLDSVRLSIELFQEAIALDPEYGPALVDYAVAEMILTNNYNIGTFEQALAKAKPALDKAAQLDHLSADYYATLGLYYSNAQGIEPDSFGKSKRAFEKALQLNPNNVRAYMWWSSVMVEQSTSPDRYVRSLELLEKAMALDPLNRVANGNYAGSLDAVGRTGEAERVLEHLIKTDPDYSYYTNSLAFLYLANYRLAETAETLKDVSVLAPSHFFMMLQLLLAFDDEQAYLAYLDTLPLDSPGYDIAQLLYLSLTATTSELSAEAELFLLRPDTDLRARPLLFGLARSREHELIIRIMENGRPYYRDDTPGSSYLIDNDPHDLYLAAIYYQGQVERARRFASFLLQHNKDKTLIGTRGKGLMDVSCYLVLGDRDAAIESFLEAVDAGWLGYYQIGLHNDLLFNEIRDDPKVKAAKAIIDERLNNQRPRVYTALRDAGLVKSL